MMCGPFLRKRAITYSPGYVLQYCYTWINENGEVYLIQWI
jgi:hypothetical protein